MALVLPVEIHDSMFGRMLLAYRKTLFIQMVNMNVLVLPVVHRHLLHLLVMITSVSLVAIVQDIMMVQGSRQKFCNWWCLCIINQNGCGQSWVWSITRA